MTDVAIMRAVDKGRRPEVTAESSAFCPILEQCWQQDSSHRPTFAEVYTKLSKVGEALPDWGALHMALFKHNCLDIANTQYPDKAPVRSRSSRRKGIKKAYRIYDN